jgi:superfamily II DNA or RNA helicase
MSYWHPFHEGINLHGPDRISAEDAARQMQSARAILHRLTDQPGVVLADEVGMGKTFVALAVAASVALSDRRRPVVVMVPPSLKEKWPRDFGVFTEQCLTDELCARLTYASAETAVQFLKLLDNPQQTRPSLIFLTHGAMSRSLTDGWVRLAIIHRALYRRRDYRLRNALGWAAASLVEVASRVGSREALIPDLLSTDPRNWLEIMRRHNYEPEDGDEPVPATVVATLRNFDTEEVYEALSDYVPRNYTDSYEERLYEARPILRESLKGLWRKCLAHLQFKLPLLVLDEAHHLKNPHTQLAKLFSSPEAEADAEEISRGALGGVFERMLFLTATPFQLGHHELCSVLERFDGIAWKSKAAPPSGREEFKRRVADVRQKLDAAQESALTLDLGWGLLRDDDLIVDSKTMARVEDWWQCLPTANIKTPQAERVLHSFERTRERMRAAEEALRPWVIRHLKPRYLPPPYSNVTRRVRLLGEGIVTDVASDSNGGLTINGAGTLPFLLAARATVSAPDSRPLFAEGLASSYEAFRHTRQMTAVLDEDSLEAERPLVTDASRWYLTQLDRALPLSDPAASASHPKIAATVARVLAAWRQREKVLVFCHFIRTGQALRRVISHELKNAIFGEAANRLGYTRAKAEGELERLGKRFFDRDSPARRSCDQLVAKRLVSYTELDAYRDLLVEAVRRYLRTPSFLVRYFPIEKKVLNEASVEAAFATTDESGISLGGMLDNFFKFLARRCSESERRPLLLAIDRMKTGDITTLSSDEAQGDERAALLANVRLVNGATRSDTRQRLMLTFNSPFFPEVMIASSVMAEGVDLQRFCRYVIHHDLDWNPSTLEQRTGRIDRIGAKGETSGQPIRVYLPFIAETQDEKMYRVVMDRERWFSVVMGEEFKVDARNTEALSRRIPLPTAVASDLSFRLEVEEPGRAASSLEKNEHRANSASLLGFSKSS